jgi:hypothetical protein
MKDAGYIIKLALGGGAAGAMMCVVAAQQLVRGVEASQDKTLMAVGVGFVLGTIAGALFATLTRKQSL